VCELRFSEKQLQDELRPARDLLDETPVRDHGKEPEKGAKPAVGCRADTCDREKAGSRIRLQCSCRTVSSRSVKVLEPRSPMKGVPCLIGTGLY